MRQNNIHASLNDSDFLYFLDALVKMFDSGVEYETDLFKARINEVKRNKNAKAIQFAIEILPCRYDFVLCIWPKHV